MSRTKRGLFQMYIVNWMREQKKMHFAFF